MIYQNQNLTRKTFEKSRKKTNHQRKRYQKTDG